MLCSDGKWKKIDRKPSCNKLRRLKYGFYKGFYLGKWTDGEEAVYRVINTRTKGSFKEEKI